MLVRRTKTIFYKVLGSRKLLALGACFLLLLLYGFLSTKSTLTEDIINPLAFCTTGITGLYLISQGMSDFGKEQISNSTREKILIRVSESTELTASELSALLELADLPVVFSDK